MKKGFTLIELLAVVIILAILMVLVVPNVLDTLKQAREKANINNVSGLVKTTQTYISENMLKGNEDDTSGNLMSEVLKMTNGREPESGEIRYDKDKGIAVAAVYDKECYVKNYNEAVASKTDFSNCTLEKADVIHTLTNGGKSSCYETSRYLESYDVNYDVCKVVLPQTLVGISEEALHIICSDEYYYGKDDEIYYHLSLRNSMMGNEELVDTLVTYGVISNPVYSGVLIEDYKCLAGNTNGYPEIANVVFPTKINDEYVKGINTFPCDRGITSLDVSWLYELEYLSYEGLGFCPNVSGTFDLSNSTKLETVSRGTFFSSKVHTLKLPQSLKMTNEGSFTQHYNLKEIGWSYNLEIIGEDSFGRCGLSNTLDLSKLTKLTKIDKEAFQGNKIKEVILPKYVSEIGEKAFLKAEASVQSESNLSLVKIVNPTGRSFDWSSITGSNTANQIFVTGTIIHQDGNIEVVAS